MGLTEADHLLALSAVRGIGGIRTRKLLQAFGSAEAVFRVPLRQLLRVPGLPESVAREIAGCDVRAMTDGIREACTQQGIRMIPISDPDYPARLLECPDAPFVLFFKGKADLNHSPVLSVVGTRKISAYGQGAVRHLIEGLAAWTPLVVSGLAYGVDIHAHRCALKAGLETIAVLPGGIDMIYPSVHSSVADKMVDQGGLLTEMPPGTIPEKEYFPVRNRIIAGICEAVLVVESGKSGGSMITAYLAQGYHREVLAVPGRINDPYSEGPNRLIRDQVAHMVTSAEQIADILGWGTSPERQLPLFEELEGEEKSLIDYVASSGTCAVDEIIVTLGIPPGKISSLLLSLECKGYLRMLPGDQVALS